MKKSRLVRSRGITLIEILVAIGVFGVIVFAVARVFVVAIDANKISANRVRANFLMEEYLEKVRSLRRAGWDNINLAGKYIVEKDMSNNIILTPTVLGETIDGFTRYVEFFDVYRDADGNIVTAGGTFDPSSKKAAVYVSWSGVYPGDLETSTILTRYLDNLAWTQTTVADFNAGTHSGTVVINNSGGEVVLGSGGSGDWCDPNLDITGLDLDGQGIAKALTAIQGRAFAVTGSNASGKVFSNINITNTSPPVASILGYYDAGKGNDVFGEQNYGYVTTDNPSPDVVIIDITASPYTTIGSFTIPDHPSNGNSIFVYGNTGYVTQGSKLWNFDLSSKIGSRSAVDPDGVTLAGAGNSVVVRGSYAYVAVGATSKQLQIVDVSTNPANMQIVGWADLPAQGGRDVFINETETRAYVVTAGSSSQREFFIVNIEQKTGARSVISSYDTNGMSPKGVEVVPGARAIIVGTEAGTEAEEYQVVRMSTETNPVRCGGLNIESGVFDSASVLESDNDAYTYIVTGDASSEFKIIEGGPGGQYSASGIFESQTLERNYSTAFNRFFVNFNMPSQTNIYFRVAVKDAIAGNCSGVSFTEFDFLGPYTASDAIILDDDGLGYENPGQCLRVRVYLSTSDFSQTPTLYDFSVNYSP